MPTRPITRPITSPIARAVNAGSHIWNPRALFALGEEGFWFDNNDLSTLFQDAAGTTPVTAADQPVGLQLDKSRGLVLGSELVTNGDFSAGSSGWVLGTGWSVSGGSATHTLGSGTNIGGAVSVTAGRTYEVRFDVLSRSGGALRPRFTGGTTSDGALITTLGAQRQFITALAGNSTFAITATLDCECVVDNISVRELPGNHRFQTAAASRPMLRYNATTGSHYLAYDGSDDFLQTNAINFTATDKVSVFAGVRKLSDAAVGIACELSATSANSGSFAIFSPGSPGSYLYRSTGTIVRDVGSQPKYPSPASSVISGISNILGDTAILRVNGVLDASNTLDQGTGTYGNYPMYFGRRGGTSLPFNGHEYSPVCVGRLTTAAEIANIERLLARQVGVTLA